VTKADFVKAIKEKADLATIAKAEAVYGAVFEILADYLKVGEAVSVFGFGSFKVTVRSARKGRNPQTGKPMQIPESKSVRFTPAKKLKGELKGAKAAKKK
jgi:DNA-binding protein HU-beta